MNGRALPRFVCDAMMKGLARWLRACGYDVTWTYGIDDALLLDEAVAEGRIVLTADGGILRSKRVRDGRPHAIEVSNRLPPFEQVRVVLAVLGLPLRTPRCMSCGGGLRSVDKADVEDEAPPRTFAWLDRYDRCQRCGKLLWKGTHWQRIGQQLETLEQEFGREV